MSGALEIDQSKVEVLDLRQGSVIVETEVTVDGEDPEVLERMKAKLKEVLKNKNINFGGPILEYSLEGEEITKVQVEATNLTAP